MKQPYYIHLLSRAVFCFAGIWDSWKDVEGKELRTYSILTCESNETMAPIHNRMPVIIPKEKEDIWTNLTTPVTELLKLLVPYDASNMTSYAVSTMVNKPGHDDKRLVEPLPDGLIK